MIKHKDQRVAVFVDAQNMYHSAKNLYNANVNFGEVLKQSVAGRVLVRALAYGITSPGADEAKFLDALSKQGFELRTKDLQIFPGGAKKGDWDVGMAVDAIKIAEKVDVIVLVTGDGDFIPLVHYLQENKGCLVELVSFGRSTSSKLMNEVDDFFDLGHNEQQFLFRNVPKQRFARPAGRRKPEAAK
jgi:uncharacterized protein (TIGR00288 family)